MLVLLLLDESLCLVLRGCGLMMVTAVDVVIFDELVVGVCAGDDFYLIFRICRLGHLIVLL
jgi:hypothetical protein